MKLLSASQLQRVESASVQKQGITLTDLMDRAAWALFSEIKKQHSLKKTDFTLVCGPGNNGGDGLVLALMLLNTAANVKVYLLESGDYSSDNLYNQERVQKAGIELEKFSADSRLQFPENAVIIDALFGYGLNRPIDKSLGEIISQINAAPNKVISVDIPSGMFSDRLNGSQDPIVKAVKTLTFHSPKFSFFLPENEEYTGEFKILDIGLDREICENEPSVYFYTLPSSLKTFIKTRKKFSYKYKYGNVLLIAGSYGKIGAAVLAAKAAMRSGAGLVTVYLPKCGYTALQTAVPEAMVQTDFSEDKIIGFPDASDFDTIGIGPGLGTDPKTVNAFRQFLEESDLRSKKLIIDADGINILSQNPDLLERLPAYTILTPQDKELERLIGTWANSEERLLKASDFSKKHNLILVGKGPYSQVFSPENDIYFNSTGNAGMATAGSGDILTGMIAGMAAVGYSPIEAARISVWLHGKAGDRAAKKLGEESVIASDLIRNIPYAMKKLRT